MVLAGCLVLGLAEWSLLVVGQTGDNTGTFLLVALATALVVGVVFEGRAAGIALATFAGPFAAAGWTAPRGDNDGLWGLIFPMLIVIALIGSVLIAVARRVLPAGRWQLATRSSVASHLAIGMGVVLVAGGASFLLLERRPDPYPGLERALATFPAPRSLARTATRRAGDPLCDVSCIATVEASYSSSQPTQATCATIETALAKWRDTVAKSSEPIFRPVVCSWDVTHAGIDASIDVSDDPVGTTVTLTFYDPRRRHRSALHYQL